MKGSISSYKRKLSIFSIMDSAIDNILSSSWSLVFWRVTSAYDNANSIFLSIDRDLVKAYRISIIHIPWYLLNQNISGHYPILQLACLHDVYKLLFN